MKYDVGHYTKGDPNSGVNDVQADKPEQERVNELYHSVYPLDLDHDHDQECQKYVQVMHWLWPWPCSGDAQAEEPLVERARGKELQSFEERAKGCQRSQG